MRVLGKVFILEFVIVTIFGLPLHAKMGGNALDDANSTANPAQSEQAPVAMTKKITDLVHAGKYAEAQQLTTGLLVAYPNDQRLIKTHALIEKLLAPAGSTKAPPVGNQQANNAATAQPTPTEQLSGMDKVDYNALIELARQARQNTDLEQQRASLKQFMEQSSPFLAKYPNEILVWQLRAASAISLDDPIAGYDAGQKLLAVGAADSNDTNLQRLLAQLKNKGWLDKQEAERQAKYVWIWGTWSVRISHTDQRGHVLDEKDISTTVDFPRSDSVIEGYSVQDNGERLPFFRVTVLDSGEMRCQYNGQPALGCGSGNHNEMMTIVLPGDTKDTKTDKYTWLLHKK